MANTLLINKLTGGYFQFVLNGDTANAVRGIKNDLLAVGEQLHFKTGNGANIIKEQFIYPADLTIVASGTFTFSTVDQVWTKLIEIGYFDWINSGGSGTGASRFDDLLDTFKYTGKDGQVVIVNESQQKLQTVELYNYRTFTDLEDTPDVLLANKMVATNEAGTALIFKNLPEDPVNYLNSVGFFDYNDLATQTTAISVTANTDTKLTNDTLGAYTNINYPPYGVSSLWDTTTNRFNFSQLSIGDTIDVRVHLQVTTTASNQSYKIGAKFGIGSASAFDNIIFTDQAKTAGVHEVSFVAPFYIGEANILNNPAELYINTDASATVKVDGWYIRVLRRNINIVNVETGVDDATTTVKGVLRLAGDLAGTATNPTVPALADKALKSTTITINGTTFDLSANREWTISADATWGGIGGLLSNQTDLQSALNAKEPTINAGTTSQYWRGDKSWQTLDKTAVGLANVDNTSDANKPISIATQTALNLKANDDAVVKLTGNQSIDGEKKFNSINILESGSYFKHIISPLFSTGYTTLSGISTGLSFGIDSSKIARLSINNLTQQREYILPNKDGSIALTSDLHNPVTISTANGLSINTSQQLSLALASSSTNGALSSTDWNTFNSKLSSLSGAVLTTTDQNVAGVKKFTDGLTSDKSYNQKIISGTFMPDAGYGNFFQNDRQITFVQFNSAATAVTQFSFIYPASNTNQFYYLPDASGTLALTSNLHNAVTIGTANGLSLSTQVLSLSLASGSANGALSSTDWNTFNNKQNALTNPITGTGTTNFLSKFTASGTIGNSLIYDNGTNVGIGTTSFAGDELLMVSMNGTTNTQAINLKDRNASANASTFMVFRKSDDTFLGNIRRSGTSDALYIGGNSFLALGHSGNTEAMRITSGGNVGIGTTSPSQKLDVYDGATNEIASFRGASNSVPFQILGNVNVGDYWRGVFTGHNIVTNATTGKPSVRTAGFRASAIGYSADGAQGYLGFFTTNSTTANTDLSERMRITEGGNVGIGTTAPTSRLHVVGLPSYADNATAIAGGLTVGAFYHTAGVLKVVI